MEAPIRSNPVGGEKTLAERLRSIEVNMDTMAKTINSLRKPKGKESRLIYDKGSKTFGPVSFWTWSKNVPEDIVTGLRELNEVAKKVYDEIRELPNTQQTQNERAEFRKRFEFLCKFAVEEIDPCLDALKDVYGSSESQEKRGTEESVVYKIHFRGTQILRCLTKSKEMLDAAAKGENYLMQSMIFQGEESGDGITEVLPIPKEIPKNIELCLDQLVRQHERKKELYQGQEHRFNEFLEVDADLIVQFLEDHKLIKQQVPQKDLLKAAIVMENNTRQYFNNATRLATPNHTFWLSYQIQSFHEHQHVRLDAITPTSQRVGNDELNHLVNFKVQYDPLDHHLSVTCGVINTERKAKEFIIGIERCLSSRQGDPIPLRIVLHQLNSFYTGEGKFVQLQNHFARYIENYFKSKMNDPQYCFDKHIAPSEQPIVANINSALNGAARSGYIEDSYSHTMNLEGLATQSIWLLNDCKHFSIFQDKRIQDNLALLIRLRTELAQEKENIHSGNLKFTATAERLQDELNSCLYETAKICKSLSISCSALATENEFEIVEPKDNDLTFEDRNEISEVDLRFIKVRLIILGQILGSQILADKTILRYNRSFASTALNLPRLERLQEIELHLLNDIALQAITEVNCKSGLDRTGLIRSMWDAMRQMYRHFYDQALVTSQHNPSLAKCLAYEEMLNMVNKHDGLIVEVNNLVSEIIQEKKIVCMTNLFDLIDNPKITTIENLNELLKDKIRVKYKVEKGKEEQSPKFKELMNAFNYQNLVAANLIKVATVVTMDSTGVPGLKWGKDYGKFDFGANPFPPKRVPRYILIKGMQKVIQLVDEKNNLTTAGVQALILWGNLRGD